MSGKLVRFIKKYYLVFLLLIFFFINYKVKVEDAVVYEDVVSSAVSYEVAFPFQEITGFAIRDNNAENREIYENQDVSFEITLFYGEEVVWQERYDGVHLQTAYFTEISNDAPVLADIMEGETYRVQCVSEDVDLSDASVRFYGERRSFQNIYSFISIVSAVVLAGAITAIDHLDKIGMARALFGILLGLGILWNMVTPPISVPDEEYHLGQAWMVSDRILGVKRESEDALMVPEDINFVRYCQVKQTLYSFYDHLFDSEYNDIYMPFDGQLHGSRIPGYAHLIPGIGITVGRILNLNYEWIMLLGRLANLLFTSLLIALAVKMMPFGEKGIFALALFPMSVNLLGSMSYDSLNLALSILFFAMCMNYICKKERICWKHILGLTLVAAVFVSIKVIYLPMVLLCFLIPVSKFGSGKKWMLGNGVICAGSCLILGLQRLPEIAGMLGISFGRKAAEAAQQAGTELAEPDGYTLGWVFDNLGETIKIFIRSIYEYGDSYVMTAIGSRFNDVTISTVLIFALLLFFILLSLGDNQEFGNPYLVGGTAIGIAAMVVALGMASMFFAFIDYGAYVITGVQGRYFLPLFLLFPLAVNRNVLQIRPSAQHAIMKWLITVDMVVFMAVFTDTLRW